MKNQPWILLLRSGWYERFEKDPISIIGWNEFKKKFHTSTSWYVQELIPCIRASPPMLSM